MTMYQMTQYFVSPNLYHSCEEGIDQSVECIFRKADAQWGGMSRGWEIILSYSSTSNITSGYVKGTKKAKLESIVEQLNICAAPVSHPLLLPIIMLTEAISAENDARQRDARDQIRRLETALAGRYGDRPVADGYTPQQVLDLDSIQRTLVDTRSAILSKRPQTWRKTWA